MSTASCYLLAAHTLRLLSSYTTVQSVNAITMCIYFQELLMQQPKKQAIIFLKDVTFSNLQALIHVWIQFFDNNRN